MNRKCLMAAALLAASLCPAQEYFVLHAQPAESDRDWTVKRSDIMRIETSNPPKTYFAYEMDVAGVGVIDSIQQGVSSIIVSLHGKLDGRRMTCLASPFSSARRWEVGNALRIQASTTRRAASIAELPKPSFDTFQCRED